MATERTGVKGLPRGLQSGLIRYLTAENPIAAFRANSPMPRDSQFLWDRAVLQAGMQRLVIVEDLLNAGLTFDLPNWLGVPSLYWEATNRAGHAQRLMQPKSRGERQVNEFTGFYLPIFCTQDDFSFGIRELAAAARVGSPLDTGGATQATRNVNEAIEDQAINGAGFGVQGNGTVMTAPGFLTNPVNQFEYAGNEAWDAAGGGHSGDEIIDDVMGMIEVLQDQNFDGPYRLYIPRSYAHRLGADYKAASDRTILDRLLDINIADENNPLLTVKVVPGLPADYTLLVQLTPDVVDVVVGQTPTFLTWSDNAELEFYYMILACMVVRIKEMEDGSQGYVAGYTNWP